MARRSEVTPDDDAAPGAHLQPGGCRERRRLDASSPHEAVGGEHLAVLQMDAPASHAVNGLTESHLDAPSSQRVERRPLRLLGEPVQQMVGRLDEHDARLTHVEVMEVAGKHLEELDEGARQFDAGRSTADDDEGQRALVDLMRIRRRPLELGEYVSSEGGGVLERLHREGVLLDTGDPEPSCLGAGGDDEIVVGQVRAGINVHETLVEVDVLDRRPPEVDVVVVLEHTPHRQGDIGGAQSGRRHLVQQGLEHVVVPLVDDRRVDRQIG